MSDTITPPPERGNASFETEPSHWSLVAYSRSGFPLVIAALSPTYLICLVPPTCFFALSLVLCLSRQPSVNIRAHIILFRPLHILAKT